MTLFSCYNGDVEYNVVTGNMFEIIFEGYVYNYLYDYGQILY